MVKSARRRTSDGRRREEVERRLAALGIARRFPRAVSGGEAPVLRLRAVLPELGPVFCAFARYLSSRVDLLPEVDCQVLATVPDGRVPLPPEEVLALLQAELKVPLDEAYAVFEPVPLAANLVWQEHRALLAGGGEPVRVRVACPGLEAELERDLALLPLLAPAFGPRAAFWIGAAVDDFALAVAVEADLGRQAAAFETLAQDGAASGLAFTAPRAVAPLTSRRLLTRQELPGTDWEELAPAPAGGERSGDPAVLVCQAWLRQTFFGQLFPVDVPAGLCLLPGQRIAWTGGAFASLPAAAKESLWEYLIAAAAHDPERACAALVREMEGGPASGVEPLYQRVRQLVPFRDGGWTATDDLAGYLFLHWRCAAELGYRPRPHTIAFYRGLAGLTAVARRLAPERDALRDGLEGARLATGLGEVTRLFEAGQMRELAGSYAGAMLALPQRLNELLTQVAEGRMPIKLELIEPPAERRRSSSSAALAVLLAMAAVILLAHHLGAAGTFGPWTERVAAVLLGLLGAFLFRSLGRKP
jgi:predicted unusual protein kinase regulating ubiquinone biosynthesis (AarF/ABC1/UbiB family)